MNTAYIYTDKNDCQDCYKCIRECPVKAIRMEDQSASVIPENCIYCGHCISICPAGAKHAREDISTVKYLLQQNNRVIVSLAPSWPSEFPGYSMETMVGILLKLGFHKVSETALGAEIVTEKVASELAQKTSGVSISACCPSAVELILKYYPQYEENILKVDTPMLAHGKYLREVYGQDIKVVFIGPCIAKKKESDHNPGIIDAVITFERLKAWIHEQDLDRGIQEAEGQADAPLAFEPREACSGNLYPLAGGMISGLNDKSETRKITCMSFSGVETIDSVLKDLDLLMHDSPVFMELLSCTEGCINGPGCVSCNSVAVKRSRILQEKARRKASAPIKLSSDIGNPYNYIDSVSVNSYSESEIVETLRSIGKRSKEDEINCGGCGYECCRDFARAVLDGIAERKMCVSYMRRVAQDKATVLLQRMPYGVVIADKHMRILETNRVFIELAGTKAIEMNEEMPGLEGVRLSSVIPFHQSFKNLLDSGENVLEKDIKTDACYYHLSVFTLDGRNQLCGILHNLRAPELNRKEILKRTRAVVRENLETVQKIAFHLGENASNMETLLNSIVDIQNDQDDE